MNMSGRDGKGEKNLSSPVESRTERQEAAEKAEKTVESALEQGTEAQLFYKCNKHSV